MSMEISGNYKDYKNEYLERAQTEQDKVKRTSQEQRAEDKSEGVPIPKDEYISSEKSGSKPSGLYRLGQDENGNPKVMYDDPKKEEKKQLEQQIKAAAGDKEKVKVLEKKLAQIEGQLSQKDNDTYRRQNAVIS